MKKSRFYGNFTCLLEWKTGVRISFQSTDIGVKWFKFSASEIRAKYITLKIYDNFEETRYGSAISIVNVHLSLRM